MTDYTFAALNDKEFEILCVDVLSLLHGHSFERFKPGRDGGVDGRYFEAGGGEVILQCKHWQATPLERLVSHLKKVERPKLERLKPSRYLLAVSHQLSRTDKKKLREALGPHVLRDDDVVGREDLNDLLAKHPEVERRHYKLWIQSASVLQHMLNKAIHDRSSFSVEEMVREAKLYVPTDMHGKAINKLEDFGTVIITGAPGIGKTTLANHMVLHYMNRGFELLQIGEDLREAESAYVDRGKQIIYFDDFLGRNYLEALSGHEGSHIVRFIKRIGHDRTKRFVLTSRTTILNQGKALIDVLEQNHIERNEIEIRIETLTEMDKAHILYNHIWHSSLGTDYIDELYVDKRYRRVISHRNFNPRLVRFITDASSVSDRPPQFYWKYTQELLNNPARVWENPFEAQLDDFGRAIVLLVTLNRRAIPQDELAEGYARFVARPECSGLSGRRDFLLTLRHLVGSLLNRSAASVTTPEKITLNLFNPSIGDYVLNRYATDVPSLRAGLMSLRSETSIETLAGMVSNQLIKSEQGIALAEHVLRGAESCGFIGYTTMHVAATAQFLLSQGPPVTAQAPLLQAATEFLLSNEPPLVFHEAGKVIIWATEQWDYEPTLLEEWIKRAIVNFPSLEELQVLASMLDILDLGARARVSPALEAATARYVEENARDEFDANDVYSHAHWGDLDPAREALEALVCGRLAELGVEPATTVVNRIVEAYDIDAYAETFFAEDDRDDERREYAGSKVTDQIDDLFDRG